MHIAEEELEQYCRRKLSESASVDVEQHLNACGRCRDRAHTLKVFVDSMRTALRRSDPNVTHWEIHATDDGPLQIWVERTADGKYLSRREAQSDDGGTRFDLKVSAILDCVESFRELFPEHRCSDKCWS